MILVFSAEILYNIVYDLYEIFLLVVNCITERVVYMLEFNLDMKPGTYQYAAVLNDFAESFPFCCVGVGKYIMGDRYFTRRDGLNNYLLIITVSGCGRMVYKEKSCLLEKKQCRADRL